MNRFRMVFMAGAVLAVAFVLAACGESTVDKGDVEDQAQQFFDSVAKQQGQAKFPDIKCPDELKAEKGATTRCEAKGTDGTLGITVKVESVDDDTARLSFKADDKLNQ